MSTSGNNNLAIQNSARANTNNFQIGYGSTFRPIVSGVGVRKYRIQRTDDLFSPAWQDSGLGLLSPDGLKTTRSVDTSAQSSMFRVQAVRPLSE